MTPSLGHGFTVEVTDEHFGSLDSEARGFSNRDWINYSGRFDTSTRNGEIGYPRPRLGRCIDDNADLEPVDLIDT